MCICIEMLKEERKQPKKRVRAPPRHKSAGGVCGWVWWNTEYWGGQKITCLSESVAAAAPIVSLTDATLTGERNPPGLRLLALLAGILRIKPGEQCPIHRSARPPAPQYRLNSMEFCILYSSQ